MAVNENNRLRAYCKELTLKLKLSLDESATTELTLRECINSQKTIIEITEGNL